MGTVICTVSGKGGTGKSTVSSGLGIAAALLNKKVLLIDLDSGLRCLDMIFGIDDNIVFDLTDAINNCDLQRAVYKAEYYPEIDIIPAPAETGNIDFLKLNELVKEAESLYDFVILDFPAGADFDNYNLFDSAVFLIVSGADDVSVRDAGVISRGIRVTAPPRLIINRFDIDMIKGGMHNNIDDIIDTSLTRLIGIVPADGELLLLSRNHKIKPKGRTAKAFLRIISRIEGENVPLPKLKKI